MGYKNKEDQKNYYLDNKRRILEKQKKWAKENPEIKKKRWQEWKTNHPESYKSSQLKKSYKITFEDYNKILEEQKGVCAICSDSSNMALCVDHNHITGNIRGLLCHRCNMTLGKVHDNIDLLKKMIEYLEVKNI